MTCNYKKPVKFVADFIYTQCVGWTLRLKEWSRL